MPPSTLLFGATSILGYSIANLFPDTVLPFVTRANRAKIYPPMAGVESGRSGVAGDGF